MKVDPRIPRLPLGLTLLTTLALLLVPSLLLSRMPRPQAIGLEKLMANVSLLQSFRPTPERPVPQLWQDRLGADSATKLWRFQTRSWWQFWDDHSNGQPFLALSSRGLPAALFRTLPVPPIQVGDLVILSPDPLSRQVLIDRLQPQVLRSKGLRQRCLPRLEQEQAVFWRPTGLGVLLGPLAPLLQDFQEGCLSLSIEGQGLAWTGEAASVEGMVLQLPQGGFGTPNPPQLAPLAKDVLLDVHGDSLDQLISGLLARELIRQPLAERYGLGPGQLQLLRQTPFRLILRPRPDRAFQASLELTVAVGNQQAPWQAGLQRLADRLQKDGLSPSPLPSPSRAPSPKVPQPIQLWQRKDGVGLGGWIWHPGQRQLTLFLGPQPSQLNPLQVPAQGERGSLQLQARPRALADLGLLPPDLPEVVKRSASLWVNARPFPGAGKAAPLSQLEGSLVLQP
ncbi:MAG: hypothetical protein ACKOOH_05420 [Cyanobium sp.]